MKQFKFFFHLYPDGQQNPGCDKWHLTFRKEYILKNKSISPTLSNFLGQPFILDPYLVQFHKDWILFLSSCELQALQKFSYKTKFLFTPKTWLKFLAIALCFVFSFTMQNVTWKYIHNLHQRAKGKGITNLEICFVCSPRHPGFFCSRCTFLGWRRYTRNARRRHYTIWV